MSEPLNGKQFAEHLGVPHGTIKRWLSEGLPARRVGNRVFIEPDNARAWVERRFPHSIAFAGERSLYVVQRTTDGAIKVGWTGDVPRRCKELAKEHQTAVRLLLVYPGKRSDEQALHRELAQFSLGGEWFWPAAWDAIREKVSVQFTCIQAAS
jgi:hypothetical protein